MKKDRIRSESLDEILGRLDKRTKIVKDSEDLTKNIRYHNILLQITNSINKPQGFDQLLELIVDSAITLTGAERGFLMLFNKDGNLEFRVTRKIARKALIGEKFEFSKTVVNQVLSSRRPLFLSAIYQDKCFKVSDSIKALGLRMVMCAPLTSKNEILGTIYVDARSEKEDFGELEAKMFEAFAAQASIAIENSRLYNSSVRDDLTGLYNSTYLRNRLEEEVIRSSGTKKGTISFVIIDIDGFKAVNDALGHSFGNTILIRVADFIKSKTRRYDVASRYGNDEFAIIMPDTGASEARELIHKLHKGIGRLEFGSGDNKIAISISAGISSFPTAKAVDCDRMIVEAGHALFMAKNKGGNRIVVFGLRRGRREKLRFIGRSQPLVEIKKTITRFAATDATVLIVGETGTGKELITNLIHRESPRASKPLVVVNCGAIPDNLLESELFGYERGAFTGAYTQRKGKFELANGGTLFLDEIGELPVHLQVKILRAIEHKEIERIGSKSPIKIDVRVIAATNKDLEEEVRAGRFRKDLFYRLSVATLGLPPIRERPDDILLLSKYYLGEMNSKYKKRFTGFTKSAEQAMLYHPWPGNVRELMHRIERAVIMVMGNYLDEEDLGLIPSRFEKSRTLKELTDRTERECLRQALTNNQWSVTRAAKELGISRQALRYLVRKHHLSASDL